MSFNGQEIAPGSGSSIAGASIAGDLGSLGNICPDRKGYGCLGLYPSILLLH